MKSFSSKRWQVRHNTEYKQPGAETSLKRYTHKDKIVFIGAGQPLINWKELYYLDQGLLPPEGTPDSSTSNSILKFQPSQSGPSDLKITKTTPLQSRLTTTNENKTDISPPTLNYEPQASTSNPTPKPQATRSAPATDKTEQQASYLKTAQSRMKTQIPPHQH